jgi:hypothetical protein
VTKDGISLKDLDLHTRLFKYRCSYMIYTDIFRGLPVVVKQRVYQQLQIALGSKSQDYAYLPVPEKKIIREILKATLSDLPRNW